MGGGGPSAHGTSDAPRWSRRRVRAFLLGIACAAAVAWAGWGLVVRTTETRDEDLMAAFHPSRSEAEVDARAHPRDLQAQVRLGLALIDAREYPAAIEKLSAALALPSDPARDDRVARQYAELFLARACILRSRELLREAVRRNLPVDNFVVMPSGMAARMLRMTPEEVERVP